MTKDLEYPGCGQHAPCFEALTRRNTPVYSLHLLTPLTQTQVSCVRIRDGLSVLQSTHVWPTLPQSRPPFTRLRGVSPRLVGHLDICPTLQGHCYISSLQICNARDSAVPNSFIIIVEELKSQDTQNFRDTAPYVLCVRLLRLHCSLPP